MTASTLLLAALLIAVLAAVVLLALLLRRRPEALLEAHRERLEQALRDEQRDGRGELRQTLDGLSQLQAQRIDGFGTRLGQFSERTEQRLELLRETLSEDARKARSEGAEQQQRFA